VVARLTRGIQDGTPGSHPPRAADQQERAAVMTPFLEYTRMEDGVLIADNGERLQTEPRDLFWIGNYGGLDEAGALLLPVSYVFNPDTSRYWRVHGPERAEIVRGLNGPGERGYGYSGTESYERWASERQEGK
jgi:hypothetical protein